ncbi:MAG: biopolymer transporter ExbD [Nitrospirae bacterium]|nr:biopolymer transporter ExbD [Nitrospirota bacterium]MBI3351567.1 biopolymer transporter ExbD [Nitrospirota bacterium]
MIRNKTRRHLEPPRLNLTAMVDVFTVLLVFLLKSYATEGNLTAPVPVNLPVSTASTISEMTIVVTVTEKALFLENSKIEDSTFLSPETADIPKFNEALSSFLQKIPNPPKEKKVTILGDKKTPYYLLKKVIYTCAQNGLSDISLAVFQKGGGG